MKLTNYIERLVTLLTKYGDRELIYSINDEGNKYEYVVIGPELVNYLPSEKEITETPESETIAVVCVN